MKKDIINKSLNINTPKIFEKKTNKLLFKPLQYVINDTGKTRHYPPAAQEWFNSVYNYNKSLIKTLPVLDKNLIDILKSYYNMRVNHRVLKIKRKVDRYRRFSPRKIFVGKGELKHTSSKVIITMYLYNTEKMYLMRELRKIYKFMFLAKHPIIINYSWDRIKEEWITSYNRPYTLKEFSESPTESRIRFKKRLLKVQKNIVTYREIYISTIANYVYKLTSYLSIIVKYYKYLTKLVDKNILINDEKLLIFSHKLPNIEFFKYPKFNDKFELAKWSYLKKFRRLLYLLKINRAKSEPNFLIKLSNMVKNMYNKEVEFNVVELNQMHLNSDIFTQAVALKLKNRKNSLYRVLRASLRKIDLPNVNRMSEKYYKLNKNNLRINNIRNSYISSMFDNTSNMDYLSKLLLDFFPLSENLKVKINKKKHEYSSSISLETYVLKRLKHLKLAGIRVEAKGRLTKRFTASRSVFKLRWKGGLKNVDSSFKGLPTVMLRSIAKSNVQYSLLNSKNRNGAFGIKGWIGSK